MGQKPNRKLILETGQEFSGTAFGAEEDKVLEIVFNTSMAGYQEILSDPSYTDQAVVMTYPLIGNTGICAEDYESERPTLGALIVREYNGEPSNFRSVEPLEAVMKRFGIAGISGIDTRKLNRLIRDHGTCRALITAPGIPLEEGLERIRSTPVPQDAVARVSAKSIRKYTAPSERFHVAAIDCGMKQNIVRSFLERSCSVTVVPWNTPPDVIRSLHADGIFLSNGPGNPEDVPETIGTVRELLGFRPLFGICLGHQILSLAYGARTYKLKFGHRGGNHPVKNLLTGKIEITSQNHSYAVDALSLTNTPLSVTHLNLLDGTVEGVRCTADRAMSVQYHPESAPGPRDSAALFDTFIQLMEEGREHA